MEVFVFYFMSLFYIILFHRDVWNMHAGLLLWFPPWMSFLLDFSSQVLLNHHKLESSKSSVRKQIESFIQKTSQREGLFPVFSRASGLHMTSSSRKQISRDVLFLDGGLVVWRTQKYSSAGRAGGIDM